MLTLLLNYEYMLLLYRLNIIKIRRIYISIVFVYHTVVNTTDEIINESYYRNIP